MTTGPRRMAWLVGAIIWASGVVLVLAVQLAMAKLTRGKFDLAEAVALAMVLPLVGLPGVMWGLRQRQRPRP